MVLKTSCRVTCREDNLELRYDINHNLNTMVLLLLLVLLMSVTCKTAETSCVW